MNVDLPLWHPRSAVLVCVLWASTCTACVTVEVRNPLARAPHAPASSAPEVAVAIDEFVYLQHQPFGAEILLANETMEGSRRYYRYERALGEALEARGVRLVPSGSEEPHVVLRGYLCKILEQEGTGENLWRWAGVFLQSATLFAIPMYFTKTFETQVVFSLRDSRAEEVAYVSKTPLLLETASSYALALGRFPAPSRALEATADEVVRTLEAIAQGRGDRR